MVSFFKKKSQTESLQNEASTEWDTKGPVPSQYRNRLIGCPPPEDYGGKILFNGVVNAKLIKPSTDYEFVTHILARTDSLLAHFRAKAYSTPTRFTVEGTYEGLKEVDEVANDSIFSFAISHGSSFFKRNHFSFSLS